LYLLFNSLILFSHLKLRDAGVTFEDAYWRLPTTGWCHWMKLCNASVQTGRAVERRGRLGTRGFPLSAYCHVPLQPPLTYVNHPKALTTSQGHYAGYYYQHTLNKIARRLCGNAREWAGRGSVTSRGRCEGDRSVERYSVVSVPTSHVRAAAMFSFLIVWNYTAWRWGCLQRHNIHIKFGENPSAGTES
jgi:hypothetical protein